MPANNHLDEPDITANPQTKECTCDFRGYADRIKNM